MRQARKVLVTGATGTVGSGLIPALQARDVSVRALVRDATKAAGLRGQGVEVALGDLDRPETLGPALAGVDKVYLLTWNGPTSVTQSRNLIEAAKRSGRPHIVRHGAHGSSRSRIVRDHDAVEAALAASGLPVTVLKPTWFMQNAMMAAGSVASEGVIWMPFKDGRVGMIDVRDIVDVAVEVLTGEGHVGASYVLTGPASVSFQDVARALSRSLGKAVAYVDVPPEVGRQGLVSMGLPEWIAEGYLELIEDFARNWGDHVTRDVERVTGHPARSIETFARDFADAFRGRPAVAGHGPEASRGRQPTARERRGAMAHVIVKHTVEDYGKWRPLFDGDAGRRSGAGCKSAEIYRDAENPNALTVVMEFGSQDQAHAFASDPALAEVMGEAGVIGRPEVSYLDFVDKLAS